MAAGSETKKGLKCSSRRLAAIVPKDEFIEVYLELGLTHTVVGADRPGVGIWRIGDALGSPIRTLFRGRIADN